MNIIGYIGEQTQAVVQCSKCGCELRDDHGFVLSNGQHICKNAVRCSLRQSRNRLDAAAANGEVPRWRKV